MEVLSLGSEMPETKTKKVVNETYFFRQFFVQFCNTNDQITKVNLMSSVRELI